MFKRSQLRYFVTVVEEGQITSAAAKLHLAQPALTRAIANLEAELGLQLLERHARGVTLTPAGEAMFEKARHAVAAEDEAFEVGRTLASGLEGTVVFGTVGLPPWQAAPELVEAFAQVRPRVDIATRELPFPSTPVGSWMADVDMMISTVLSPDPRVWVQPLRSEQRVVLLSREHRLAGRSELALEDVLGETFLRSEPGVDPVWAGNWSLDDIRGGPPTSVTAKSGLGVQGTVSMIASGEAISTSPAYQAELIVHSLSGVVAIPLVGAAPMMLSLVGREDRCSSTVHALREVARSLFEHREGSLVGG